MSKNTNENKKKKTKSKEITKTEKKLKAEVTEVKSKNPKKENLSKTEKEKKKIDSKENPKKENKSVQNKVIDNIKNFISKIIEVQEKVRLDEEEEKKLKKKEKDENENKNEAPKYLLEYYDLPFRYNETVVKILAQTPKRLFVYWDVSDKDKQTYINAFGERFFEDTYPVLLVHNEDKNYTSEIAINDFANSWYLDIVDPRDKYTIQLGRKFKAHIKPQLNPEIEETNIVLNNDYLFMAASNKLEMPNDHILFEKFEPYVKYRNVKTNKEEVKNLTNSIYGNKIKSLYKELYNGDEGFNFEEEKYDCLNPSSISTSSTVAFK